MHPFSRGYNDHVKKLVYKPLGGITLKKPTLMIVSGFRAVGKGTILAALSSSEGIEVVRSVTTKAKRSADDPYIFVKAQMKEEM